MVVPEDQDGKFDECSKLSRDTSRPSLTVASTISRKGGTTDQKAEARKPATIIVDMREFRSELPALIHKRGIEIEPVTLQVSAGRIILHY
jgi:DNA excision repair protein ERCC-4